MGPTIVRSLETTFCKRYSQSPLSPFLLITDENLPLEIRESIQRRYERACSIGQEDEVTVTIFSDAPREAYRGENPEYITINRYDCKNYQMDLQKILLNLR